VDDALLLQYHDLEWAVPVHSDSKHFEVLVLSGMRALLDYPGFQGRLQDIACPTMLICRGRLR
jgi:hypothetical protein